MPETKTVTAPVTELNKNNVLTYEGLNYYHKTIQARIDEAKKAGTDAAGGVAQAKTDAAQAKTDAAQAKTDSQTAINTANEASTAARNAVKKADTASQAAAKAETNASAAQETATAANTKAGNAETAATEAKAAATRAENAVKSKADNSTVAAVSTRVTSLEAVKPAEKGAQVNKIESIKVNGVALSISGKSVDINVENLQTKHIYVATDTSSAAKNVYNWMDSGDGTGSITKTSATTYFTTDTNTKVGDLLLTPAGYPDCYITGTTSMGQGETGWTTAAFDASKVSLADYTKKTEAVSFADITGDGTNTISFKAVSGGSAKTITINEVANADYATAAGTASSATSADSATNVNLSAEVTSDPQSKTGDTVEIKAGSGTAASFVIETAGSALYADEASSAATAANATNVTTNINSHAINTIFENDGVTAKKATNATSAEKAMKVANEELPDGNTAQMYLYDQDGGELLFEAGTPVWAINKGTGFKEHKIITDADVIPTSDINKILGI